MSGLAIRLRIWIKLWFTSFHFIVIMLLIPFGGYFIHIFQLYTVGSLSSMIYEKAALILFVFILQWCFSIDFDSKFYGQLITYSISRWKLIVERLVISSLIFFTLLCFVTLLLTPLTGSFIWKGLLFSIPVYIGIGGTVVVATVTGNHSLGGGFAGLIFWMISLNGGALLLYLNPVLLDFPNVYKYINGNSGFFSIDDRWILYNRLFYIGLGVLLSILAVFQFNRKSF
ncbi:hypothetical protein GJU40_08185 [Bacillus lacus]|uniref:Uncharacterized protein n=1 Tax=Metabacillus lacus TaxID=1983721 RepID=A0A7X2LZV7_9BACI|nr:hypothetical protein [Metabacillus lacus]MRX72139.1 hypothetical protein [Metabacillus lacus]